MGGRIVNIALLGAGDIGSFHAMTLARLRGVRLAAVVDPVETNARAAADEGEDVLVASTPDAVLEGEAVDAVVIAAPARFHRPLIEQAARAGKHVFCEKPLALTLEDARGAVAAAASAGVKLQVGFQRRFDASYVRARQAVERGEIGAVELVTSTTRDPAPPAPGQVEAAGGIYLDSVIHDFDSMRFLAGSEVVEVYATASTLVTPERTGPFDIDTSAAVVRFASGALGIATNSLRAAYGYEAGAEVFGSKGKVVIASAEDAGVQLYTRSGVGTAYPQTFRERFGAAYRAEIEDFVRCIVEGDAPRVTGEDGVRAVEIALAATKSQCEGRPVKL